MSIGLTKLTAPMAAMRTLERGVGDLVLDGVAAFMGGEPGCAATEAAMIILRGKDEALVDRVVVVTEHFVHLDNLDIIDAGPLQNGGGSFSAHESRRGLHLAVTRVSPLDAGGRRERNETRTDDRKK